MGWEVRPCSPAGPCPVGKPPGQDHHHPAWRCGKRPLPWDRGDSGYDERCAQALAQARCSTKPVRRINGLTWTSGGGELEEVGMRRPFKPPGLFPLNPSVVSAWADPPWAPCPAWWPQAQVSPGTIRMRCGQVVELWRPAAVTGLRYFLFLKKYLHAFSNIKKKSQIPQRPISSYPYNLY